MAKIYPVGSIYFTINNVNPATTFGFGTWVQIGSKLAVSENVFGNGKTLGLTNGTDNFTFGFGSYMCSSSNIGTTPSSSSTGWTGRTGNYGVPTKSQLGSNPEYSGLIVDTETIYSFKRTA